MKKWHTYSTLEGVSVYNAEESRFISKKKMDQAFKEMMKDNESKTKDDGSNDPDGLAGYYIPEEKPLSK